MSGSTWGTEYIPLRLADSGHPYLPWNWIATTSPPSTDRTSWSFSGTLPAGEYVVSNQLIPLNNSGWGYTLTLSGASIAPAPEPQACVMPLAGMALLGLFARRRA